MNSLATTTFLKVAANCACTEVPDFESMDEPNANVSADGLIHRYSIVISNDE